MRKITSILVIANRDESDKPLLEKAVHLARRLGARIELFTCDSEHAYIMRRAYDDTGVEKAWLNSFSESCEYLETLCQAIGAADVSIAVDAVCDSPHYQAVVDKVRACRPDLVMKCTSGAHPLRRFTLDSNDWELMRACPATLVLSRGKSWGSAPRFAAMVDVSDQEACGLPESIAATASLLANACGGEVEMAYGEQDIAVRESASHTAKLRALAAANNVGSERVHVLPGNPEEALAGFAAQEGFDAIILGALSHREELTSLVGRLTGRLVEALTCDFVLVKAPQTASTQDAATPRAQTDPHLAA